MLATINPRMTSRAMPPPMIPTIHQITWLFFCCGVGALDIVHPPLGLTHPIRKKCAQCFLDPCGVRGPQSMLIENNFYVRTLFKVHCVDEAHLSIVERQDQRMRARAFAEKAHA